MTRVRFEFEGPRGRVRAVARAMGEAAMAGDVVALVGPLGAGKTVFAQAFLRGAGVAPSVRVASPTFAIVHEYEGRVRLMHADLYRLSGPEALDEVGLFALGVDAITVVEWPERAGEAIPRETVWVTIARATPLRRRVEVAGEGPRAEALIAAARVGFESTPARRRA